MEPFFQSVGQAFSGNRAALPRVEAAILALLALAVLLQLTGLVRRLLARRSRYHRLLLSRGLSGEDLRFGAALARRAHLEPLQLVTHLDAFERATAQALQGPDGADAGPRIRRLRHALGFDRLPAHTPLLSTRELPAGTALEVGALPGTVTEVDEAGFTVEAPEPPAPAAGQQVALVLRHAREARYALGCRLREARPEPGGGWLLRFEHDEHPVRQQQRAYVRVELDAPIRLEPVTAWQGLPAVSGPVQGRLVDLSGGGALVACRPDLPVGFLVLASFEVAGARFEGLRAVVLSVEAPPEGPRRLHLEFTGRGGAERERLVHALTRLELQAQAIGHG